MRPQACSRRILVLATGAGGGNWPPLAAVTVGLHRTGHVVKCYGDATIERDLAAAAAGVDVVPAEHGLRSFIIRWQEAGGSGPSPLRAWAEACAPSVRSFATDLHPTAVVSELFTVELARLTKIACGIPYCFVNPDSSAPGPGSARRRGPRRRLGVAEVISRQDLTEVRLSGAIRKVLGTARHHEAAAQIATRMEGRDAVASACARIEEFMDKNSRK